MYQPSIKARRDALETRNATLRDELAHAQQPPALLHPNMAQEYRKRIDGLVAALQDARTMLDARDDIRALVGRIVVSPEAGGAGLWLEGDLAGILSLASGTKTPARAGDARVLTSVVAGVGFEPTTFRL